MPIYQTCGRKWSWLMTEKQLLHLVQKMRCEFCGHIQYPTKSSRNRMSFTMVGVLFSLIIFAMPASPNSLIITLYGVIAFIVIAMIYPFLIKLTNQYTPPFDQND